MVSTIRATMKSRTHPQKRLLSIPVVCKHNQSVLLRSVADCDWRLNRVQLVCTTKFLFGFYKYTPRISALRDRAVIKDQAFIESTSRKILAKFGK